MASNFVQDDLGPSRSVQIFGIYSNSPLPAAKKKKKIKAGVWMGGTSVSRRLTTISLPYRNHITATWNEQRNTLSQSGLVQRRNYRWLCQDSTTMYLHMCFVGHESTLQLYAPPPGAREKAASRS